jgi:hypothetical protein
MLVVSASVLPEVASGQVFARVGFEQPYVVRRAVTADRGLP